MFDDIDMSKVIDPSLPPGTMRVFGTVVPAPIPGISELDYMDIVGRAFDRDRLIDEHSEGRA